METKNVKQVMEILTTKALAEDLMAFDIMYNGAVLYTVTGVIDDATITITDNVLLIYFQEQEAPLKIYNDYDLMYNQEEDSLIFKNGEMEIEGYVL